MEEEHKNIAALLEGISTLTNSYTFPQNACTNHRVIYHKLRELKDNIEQHKHLENILFPRAVGIESELLKSSMAAVV